MRTVVIWYNNCYDKGDGSVAHPIEVTVSDTCPVCGGPRGAVRPTQVVHAERTDTLSHWTNVCGHTESYERLYREAMDINARRSHLFDLDDNTPTSQPQVAPLQELPSLESTHAALLAALHDPELQKKFIRRYHQVVVGTPLSEVKATEYAGYFDVWLNTFLHEVE